MLVNFFNNKTPTNIAPKIINTNLKDGYYMLELNNYYIQELENLTDLFTFITSTTN